MTCFGKRVFAGCQVEMTSQGHQEWALIPCDLALITGDTERDTQKGRAHGDTECCLQARKKLSLPQAETEKADPPILFLLTP